MYLSEPHKTFLFSIRALFISVGSPATSTNPDRKRVRQCASCCVMFYSSDPVHINSYWQYIFDRRTRHWSPTVYSLWTYGIGKFPQEFNRLCFVYSQVRRRNKTPELQLILGLSCLVDRPRYVIFSPCTSCTSWHPPKTLKAVYCKVL